MEGTRKTADGFAASQSRNIISRRGALRVGAGGAAALALAACGSSGTQSSQSATGKPRRGGSLTAGIDGGSTSDTIDANGAVSYPDWCRVLCLYDQLVGSDANFQPHHYLADEVTPNASATQWTIRVKKGITFHNGKELTADDVIFTLQRIWNPKSPFQGASGLALLDLASLRKMDTYTVTIPAHQPYFSFPDTLRDWFYLIVPVGYDPHHPVGTGPFKFKSFTPGQQSVFVRNENYWNHPRPYIDELTITDFPDVTARVNAVQSGQVDVIDQIPPSLVGSLRGASGVELLIARETGLFNPITMQVDTPPFNDVRARQAMRLIADRHQLIQLSLGGYGQLCNDLFAIYDPAYNHSLPQRQQDIGQAMHLLKAAGQSNLTVTLVTGAVANGFVEGAQVFAQQAKQAGVTVKVQNLPTSSFYGPTYLHRPFSQDTWTGVPYLTQVAQSMLKSSPYNDTHWYDQRYASLYRQAEAEADIAKRTDIIHEMQTMEYNEGGYLGYAFFGVVDAHRSNVHGLIPSKTGWSLGNYDFSGAWLS
jgi:peptide/nickel transport system substrate-binding protein